MGKLMQSRRTREVESHSLNKDRTAMSEITKMA